jgi:hypothetical protein
MECWMFTFSLGVGGCVFSLVGLKSNQVFRVKFEYLTCSQVSVHRAFLSIQSSQILSIVQGDPYT